MSGIEPMSCVVYFYINWFDKLLKYILNVSIFMELIGNLFFDDTLLVFLNIFSN
jgi:hypothetical protein